VRSRDFEYGNAGAWGHEVTIVREIYEAFARRDLEAVLAHCADDVVFSPQGTSQLAGRGVEPYRGHDGLRQYFADVERVWEELTLFGDDIRATAGGVVVFGHVEGAVDGRAFQVNVIWTWQVRDGKAVAIRATALGALPGTG
jgi:ketosteroid isomerase-like protein